METQLSKGVLCPHRRHKCPDTNDVHHPCEIIGEHAGLRGEDSIAELCRREGISQGIYYKWSKDFMEAGKRRLSGDTARAATTDEVKDLRREAQDLKEVVAEQTLELRLLKKSMTGDGGDQE